jgi:hypothetical protein
MGLRPSARGLVDAAALPVDLLRGALGSSNGPDTELVPEAGLGRRTRFASLLAAPARGCWLVPGADASPLGLLGVIKAETGGVGT